ncbi:MAG: stage II sporulation protein D [Oscillospiraceae bacterium]|nr:stage II sporulation protein D [Oscillospiraceae bacterium]
MKKNSGKYAGTTLILAIAMILIPLTAGGGLSKITDELVMEPKPESTAEAFKVLDYKTGTVSEVSAFDYICGTVAQEMPISFEPEALKAQAVAAYTYAERQRRAERENPNPDLKGADLTNNPSVNQGYMSKEELRKLWGKSFETYYKKLSSAVEPVLGECIVYKGEPILAAYHALSAGKTENSEDIWGGELAYLAAVDSPGDVQAAGYESTVTLTIEELKQELTAAYPEIKLEGEAEKWISDIKKTDSGTVTEIKIGSQVITGAGVRNILGLRSACFDVKYADGSFTFTVHGYGHGVGLSQTGANYMAKNGADYISILKHYYSGVEVE